MKETAKASAAPTNDLQSKPLMERIVSLAKRRGFIFQASEIYGGMNGVHDYGPLGAQLKKNFKNLWWRDMVEVPPEGPDGKPLSILGLDSAILQKRDVWDAVGHTTNFNDMMVDDRETKQRYRADHLICHSFTMLSTKDASAQYTFYISAVQGEDAESRAKKTYKTAYNYLRNKFAEFKIENPFDVGSGFLHNGVNYLQLSDEQRKSVFAPDAKEPDTLTEPRAFNLMFETYVGAMQSEDSKTFLRPETCQGIFTNFKNVLDSSRVKPPFGIAQIGKAFRNEVTPRNFIFRTREFEQMELEFFCAPEESLMWFEFWVAQRVAWWAKLGIKGDNLYQNVISAEDRAFYSQGTTDLEYRFPFSAPGHDELEGIAHRGDFDLSKHNEHSNTKQDYFDQEANKRYVPHVIEPSCGVERGVLALLCEGYQVDESRASPEWLKLDPRLAPVKLGIFPLVNKDGMPEIAEKILGNLRRDYTCQFDAKQSIGKRYARMDECGTPYCITVDGETSAGNSVTLRDRNTAQQERVDIGQLPSYLAEKFKAD